VATLEGGTFCHLWGWGEVFRQVFGHTPHRWVTRGPGGEITGLLPAVWMRSRLFGRSLISMPFLNYGGPLGSVGDRAGLAEAMVAAGKASRADRVEFRNRRAPNDLAPSREKITVVLPLPDDSEVLWTEGLKGKVRSQVRRPTKAGMTASIGPQLLDDFYEVFARNMRDLGTPVLPLSLFRAALNAFPETTLVCTVESEGVPVAGGLGFFFEGEFELTWASSLREYNRDAPNMLLYWSLMEEVIRRGGTAFNFGRCTPGGGTHRFKSQWGGVDEPLHWTQWTPDGGSEAPSAEGGALQAAVSLWQKLPLPVANRLGPLVARGLPSF
jgi:FemAB-related protein (PEP-CTERM system-associated)